MTVMYGNCEVFCESEAATNL